MTLKTDFSSNQCLTRGAGESIVMLTKFFFREASWLVKLDAHGDGRPAWLP